jgi:hypothetical protein
MLKAIKREKEQMNRIRYVMNYIVVPVFLAVTAICIVIIGVTMSTDEEKYTPLAIALFAFEGVVIVLLMISVPFVRRREIQLELSKYSFDDEAEPKDEYLFGSEYGDVVFDRNGITCGDNYYDYADVSASIFTGNYLLLVNISIEFYLDEEQSIMIPLSSETIHMLKQFGIELENPEVLEYILNNKEDAFKQIYSYGWIRKGLYGKMP